jgi:hypothetical protein
MHWFTNAKQLGAYAGLAPTVRQSNATDRRGPLTKQGRNRLRTFAIRAVLGIVRAGASPWADFSQLKKRQKGAGQALCATARKLLSILFVMLTKELDYWYLEERLSHKKLRVLQKAASGRQGTGNGEQAGPLPNAESASSLFGSVILCFTGGLVFYRRRASPVNHLVPVAGSGKSYTRRSPLAFSSSWRRRRIGGAAALGHEA